MALLAWTEPEHGRAHLVVTLPAPDTLCGKPTVEFGGYLPITRDRWPDERWCESCLRIWDGTDPRPSESRQSAAAGSGAAAGRVGVRTGKQEQLADLEKLTHRLDDAFAKCEADPSNRQLAVELLTMQREWLDRAHRVIQAPE